MEGAGLVLECESGPETEKWLPMGRAKTLTGKEYIDGKGTEQRANS